jgi:UDP-N-acetyl-D-mannosaminuronic acid transferase (WecB/TagA/CpsF family)
VKKIIFKKINFISFESNEFSKIIQKKGLFVFPSGPGLANIDKDNNYSKSLSGADYVFFDSGYFVLLLRIFKNIRVSKFSGYKFLNLYFKYLRLNKKKLVFNIDPNRKAAVINKNFFKKLGLNTKNYIAPMYNSSNIKDKKLLNKINQIKPDFVLTNIGGGVQEILGMYLKKNLKKKTSIICTGGAIEFFTGNQAPINNFLDKFYLGWITRIIFSPRIFFLRYLRSTSLIKLVIKSKIKLIS